MKYKTYSPTESEMRTELASLRRQLAEAEASAVEIERESREAWLQAANWRKRAESAEQFLRDARPLSSVELIVGESDNTVLTVTTTAGELRKLALAEQDRFTMREVVQALTEQFKTTTGDERHVPATIMAVETMGALVKIISRNRAAIAAGEGKDD